MLPITKSIPKEMLPVWDKPVIQYTVEALVDAWIKDIIMITSQQKKALEDHFDKNYELEDLLQKKWKTEMLELINKPKNMANYTFVKQTQMLWTAHAVAQVEKWIDDDYFIVIFADAIYHPDMFKDMMTQFEKKKSSLICVHEVPMKDVSKYWVVKLDWEKMKWIVEQPKIEDAPSNLICNWVYLLHRDIFDLIRQTPINESRWEYLLPDALNLLMKNDNVYPFKTVPFWDIWNIQARMDANNELYTKGKLFN
jgi:UTP--glucose-1-phosphate uridylyltransferase